MEAGTLATSRNPWGVAMMQTLRKDRAAVGVRADGIQQVVRPAIRPRERARRPHTRRRGSDSHARSGSCCSLASVAIFVYMLFFADSAERAIVQATMIGAVAIVITSTLLLLWFLDNPYHSGLAAAFAPSRWSGTLQLLQQERAATSEKIVVPCDLRGVARRP